MNLISGGKIVARRFAEQSVVKNGHVSLFNPRPSLGTSFKRNQHAAATERSALPRLIQPSMWQVIIPPTIRQKTRELLRPATKKPSNPASYFIWIYLFIGSQAIRIIGVKNEYSTYSRKADMQIEKLREVVRKLQAGEPVDVEKALGTGVAEEEQAWEDALREIESEERLWQNHMNKSKSKAELEAVEQAQEIAERQDANPVNTSLRETKENSTGEQSVKQKDSDQEPPYRTPGFY